MTATEKKNYTVPIIVMIMLFGMISFVTNLAAPMSIVVKGQFQASNFLGMLGNAANFLAYLFMGIPAGMMLKRIGYKKTALIAVAVGFVGILVQYISGQVESFAVYILGAFISGFSVCMLNTVVNPMLNNLGGGGKKGNQLIQVGGTFNSLMATITPVFVGILIGEASKATIQDVNPVLFIAMGIFLLAFIVLASVKIPEPRTITPVASKNKVKDKYSPLSFRHFVLGVIAIFCYIGVEVGVPGTLNLYLTDTNIGAAISPAIAGTVIGTYWFLMLVGRFIGASVGGRVSSRTMMLFTSTLALAFVLAGMFSPESQTINMPVFRSDLSFGLSEVPISAFFFVLVGLCTSVMWGAIFNLAVEGLGKYTEQASGIFMTMVFGGGLWPLLQNYIADTVGFMQSYWVIVVLLVFLVFFATVGYKNVNPEIPVHDEVEPLEEV